MKRQTPPRFYPFRRRFIRLLIYGLASLFSWLAVCGAFPRAIALPSQSAFFSLVADPLALAQTSLAQAPTADPETLATQGRRLYEAGDYAAAARLWRQVAELFAVEGRRQQQASSLANIAHAYEQLGRWEEAEAALEESLAILDQDSSTDEGFLFVSGQVWAAWGSLELARSEVLEAIEAFEKSEKFYQNAADAEGVLRSQINQARAMQAGGHYRRALRRLEEIAPPLEERPPTSLVASGLKTLGDLHRILGDFSTAESALCHSLRMAEHLGDAQAIATAWMGLANVANAEGQQEHYVGGPNRFHCALANVANAEGQQELVLQLYQKVVAQKPTVALTLQAQAAQLRLLLEDEQTHQAQGILEQLKQGIAALPSGRLRIYAYINAGSALTHTHLPIYLDTAVDFLSTALREARLSGDIRGESYALGDLGRLYKAKEQLAEAKELTERALATAQNANAPEVSYQWNAQLGELYQQEGNTEKAIFNYTAAVKALESLRDDLVAINDDVRFNFRESIEPIYRNLVDLLTDKTVSSQADLKEAQRVIESLQLAELENFFREACLAPSEGIDQMIDRSGMTTAVFHTIVLKDRVEVILKLPQQPLRHYSTLVSKTDLQSVDSLRKDLELPYTLKSVQENAAKLYDWLIKPVESQLSELGIETLVFVLDGSLRNIPMGLLYDGERYLIEKYAVAIAPGLRLVDPQVLTSQSLSVILAGLSEARAPFPPLQFVEKEVNQLQAILDSKVLLNQSFTQDALEALLKDISFPMVHLATHGQFSSNLHDTFILAWDGPIPLEDLNRILRTSGQTREPIELLVLSACETATGDVRAALGLAGVAVRAGARSTIASLWSLDDETTAILMDHFYAALKTPNTTRAQALREAQLSLFGSPRYRHPRYWAPYVLIGNWL